MASATQKIYRVSFSQNGQVYELFAREVSHGSMLGFVEIGDLVFGEKSSIVVDPGEEKLKLEFENVRRFYVPVHAVLRIDEVEKRGVARITAMQKGDGSNVTHFPVFTSPSPTKPGKS